MQLDNAIKKRRSVRRFKEKKPNWRDIIECIDAVRYAPMAGNNFSLKIILVDNIEKIQKLADASQQPFVGSAHFVVVFCTNPERTTNCFEERANKYTKQQAGAAIQNFLLALEEKGLATCWVGHFVDSLVQETLDIPKNIEVEAMFPIGYEYGTSPKKNRIEMGRVLYFNKFKNTKMKVPKGINI